jgi:hypothetical protein
MKMKKALLFIAVVLVSAVAFTQHKRMKMDPSDPMQMGQSNEPSQQSLEATTESMSHGHEDMGPHMKMSELGTAKPGDAERAQKIVHEAQQSLEKYKDYKAALADGYHIMLPNVPTKMKHFTNYRYALEAAFRFNPDHPTSLLYEKHGDDYKLIGAMYTAPRRFSEDQLNERVPLSVAQWHEHVNICMPPAGQQREMLKKNAQFGLNGAIATEDACNAAGGKFVPVMFGWMVHFYPWEKSPDEIWSVERQRPDKAMKMSN